jgi:FemAB-related protein (PEP-CTERM system-associated)
LTFELSAQNPSNPIDETNPAKSTNPMGGALSIKVEQIQSTDTHAWDAYVRSHPHSTLYHLIGWKNVIEKTYGHNTYYLVALDTKQPGNFREGDSLKQANGPEDLDRIRGILPLVHLNHFVLGKSLISMPFLDYGGILADDHDTEEALLLHATKLAQELGVRRIELRHIDPLTRISKINSVKPADGARPLTCVTDTHKVRLLFPIPNDSETLMKSFRAKLRSQIKKPIKEGCSAAVGHLEFLNAFYAVFSSNMRDLGSPVHSKKLIKNVLQEFPEEAKICAVFKGEKPLAASVVIGFKETLENPWASSLRKYARLSPNMLLYWTMLEYACSNGFKFFDFGRSSFGEGTYKFKEQWGGRPTALHWHYVSLNDKPILTETSEKSTFEKAIRVWQKLPIRITTIIGPRIRKHIGL